MTDCREAMREYAPDTADSDGDGCADMREQDLGTDPMNPWDFYSVPAPALRRNPSGTADNGIGSTTDVPALLAYSGFHAGLLDYDLDYDNNGVADGFQYDRSRVMTPGGTWGLGPPDGAITVTTEVVELLRRVGDTCVAPP